MMEVALVSSLLVAGLIPAYSPISTLFNFGRHIVSKQGTSIFYVLEFGNYVSEFADFKNSRDLFLYLKSYFAVIARLAAFIDSNLSFVD